MGVRERGGVRGETEREGRGRGRGREAGEGQGGREEREGMSDSDGEVRVQSHLLYGAISRPVFPGLRILSLIHRTIH